MQTYQLYTYGNKEDSSTQAVQLFVERVQTVLAQKETCRVVVPTGGSPKQFYEILTRDHADSVKWSQVVWITLDELFGIDLDHPATFYSYLVENLFTRLNISDEAIEAINPRAEDPEAECSRFGQICRDADIAILGVGADGHIGMNFPPCHSDSSVHLLDQPDHGLPKAELFASESARPVRGITMGVADILSAGWILLLVDGSSKAPAMKQFLAEEITDLWPVTYLHKHRDVSICATEDSL